MGDVGSVMVGSLVLVDQRGSQDSVLIGLYLD